MLQRRQQNFAVECPIISDLINGQIESRQILEGLPMVAEDTNRQSHFRNCPLAECPYLDIVQSGQLSQYQSAITADGARGRKRCEPGNSQAVRRVITWSQLIPKLYINSLPA